MASTPTNLPNRPAGKPVFDFKMDNGQYCRVPLTLVSNDGQMLVMTAWAFLVDSNGVPVLDPGSASPMATIDETKSVPLSGVMAGTHTLYDGWCKYRPDSQTVVSAENLPKGCVVGDGPPSGTPAYGSVYYDRSTDNLVVYKQGCIGECTQAMADQLNAKLRAVQEIAQLGLS